jgi:hypothetical protein
MAPWSPTAVSFGGSVAIPQAGCICAPQAGSMGKAGGGRTAMAGLSRWPRWPPRHRPCFTMPSAPIIHNMCCESVPQTKTPGQWLGVFALVVVGLMVVTGSMAPGRKP